MGFYFKLAPGVKIRATRLIPRATLARPNIHGIGRRRQCVPGTRHPASMMSLALSSAALRAMSGRTEVYVSAVSTMPEWPNMSCTTFGSVLADGASEAAPCLRSCSRIRRPVSAPSALNIRVSRVGSQRVAVQASEDIPAVVIGVSGLPRLGLLQAAARSQRRDGGAV
jgi:hypothetical protein